MPGPLPSVDVVIATRNRAAFIAHAIDSVRRQTLQPVRVIVVDDGSSDATASILARLSNEWRSIDVITLPPRGVSAARNTAIERSTADLIAFLDDDDVWHPEKLALQVALFTPKRHRLGLVSCGLEQIDIHGKTIAGGARLVPDRRGDIFRDLLERFYPVAPSTMVVPRALLLDAGGFDVSLTVGEDRDLCLRLARVAEADFVPQVLVGHRQHTRSAYYRAMRGEPDSVLLQRLRIWNSWYDAIVDMDAVRTRFRAEAAAAALSLAMRPARSLGLYRRLRYSELRLARELFADRRDYLRQVGATLGGARSGSIGAALPDLPASLKWAAARRFILPNPFLLRLAQRFGKFKGVRPSTGDDGGGTE